MRIQLILKPIWNGTVFLWKIRIMFWFLFFPIASPFFNSPVAGNNNWISILEHDLLRMSPYHSKHEQKRARIDEVVCHWTSIGHWRQSGPWLDFILYQEEAKLGSALISGEFWTKNSLQFAVFLLRWKHFSLQVKTCRWNYSFLCTNCCLRERKVAARHDTTRHLKHK